MARVDAAAQPPAQESRMSYEEFLAWADEDTWAEWVDGEVIVLSPASVRHQQIGQFLLMLLELYVEVHQLGVVIFAPFQMRLSAVRSGREPDILFVAREHLHRLLATRLDGPADVAVEIVSPESVERDRTHKYREYEAAGIREYWLIDPDQRQAAFYHLGPDGRFAVLPIEASGVFRSTVISGFWLRVDWLWQYPLPQRRTVLRQLGLV